MRVRIATLNVWNTEGDPRRPEIINRELRKLDPDLIAVDNPNAKAGAEQIVRQPNYRERFDYVFVGSWDAHPKAYAHIQSAALAFDQAVDGIWLSDHFGVVADLDVGKDG